MIITQRCELSNKKKPHTLHLWGLWGHSQADHAFDGRFCLKFNMYFVSYSSNVSTFSYVNVCLIGWDGSGACFVLIALDDDESYFPWS